MTKLYNDILINLINNEDNMSSYIDELYEVPEKKSIINETFGELKRDGLINCQFADNRVWYCRVTSKGKEYCNMIKNNDFFLLRQRQIIDVLIGDISLGEDDLCHMPRLSGNKLYEICLTFGFTKEYGDSRWKYLDELIEFTSREKRTSELLAFIFDMKNFSHLTCLPTQEEVKRTYREIVNAAIDKINACLLLSRKQLHFIEGEFLIIENDDNVTIESPNIDRIDAPYIRKLVARCKLDFTRRDYDSVLSKCRTTIEEVLTYIIENSGKENTAKGDIRKLYNKVKNEMNMQQTKDYDGRVNSLLSGLERIMEAISSMRNINSDAHGVGSGRVKIKEREAKLAMNSTITFCEYLLSVHNEKG